MNPLLSLLGYFGALFTLFIISGIVVADPGAQTLGEISANVTSTMDNISKLITAVSYVAGVGFAMMGMLKLKAHKEQPQQIPLSQPMMLLVIAAGLVFLPSLIKTTGATIWGQEAEHGDTKGGGVIGTGGLLSGTA